MDKPVVFLGGTCNEDPWREVIKERLYKGNVPYFDPVVKDWNEEAQKREEAVKDDPNNIQLFVITSKMTGVFSIAEAVAAAYELQDRAILAICKDGFDEGQQRSLQAVVRLVIKKTGLLNVSMGPRDEILKWAGGTAVATWDKYKPLIKAEA